MVRRARVAVLRDAVFFRAVREVARAVGALRVFALLLLLLPLLPLLLLRADADFFPLAVVRFRAVVVDFFFAAFFFAICPPATAMHARCRARAAFGYRRMRRTGDASWRRSCRLTPSQNAR